MDLDDKCERDVAEKTRRDFLAGCPKPKTCSSCPAARRMSLEQWCDSAYDARAAVFAHRRARALLDAGG